VNKAIVPAWGYLREMVSEQVQFRELLVRMVTRDLQLRYKQSVMGFGWAIFMPLLNTVLFSVIFTRVAPIDTAVPYPLFAYVGLTAWNLTASALRFSVGSLTSNGSLVTKVYFPREIFPFSAVLVSLVDTAVSWVVLVALMAYYGIAPQAGFALLPLVLVVQLLFTAAVALLLAMGNLFFRDVKYLFEIVLTVWMFASSVLYPLSGIGGRTGAVMALNPMTHIIDAYRSVLFTGQLPDGQAFVVTALCSLVLLISSWVWFHSAEYTFAENI
jgi:homopolymeric O-antigen transport system permease protein